MRQTPIQVSAGGAEYTLPVTVTDQLGNDITTDAFVMALGSYSQAPTVWRPPDIVSNPTLASTAGQILIGGSYVPNLGDYWLWYKLTDTSEVVIRNTGLRITVL